MTPTMKLRFVEKDIGGRYEPQKLIRVLQQWWEDETITDPVVRKHSGQWMDIEIGKEE